MNWQRAATTVRAASTPARPPPRRSARWRCTRGGAVDEQVTGAEPPEAAGLGGGGDSTDDQRGEHRPPQVGVPRPAERTVMATITTVGASTRMTACNPTTTETRAARLVRLEAEAR